MKEGGEGFMGEFGGRKKRRNAVITILKEENLEDFPSKSCERLRIIKATALI